MKPIDKAIEIAGGQTALADKLGVTQGFISQLKTGARPIPATLCSDIEEAVGREVTREDLRPDVFKPSDAA
ncbi:helix-turn-helix domain-containing protein [Pseudomaricurvus alkylphenolicus]|uniref:transcriptional regulator n=1 Tax=Pseudomaricurvus alkylphenolicus TaxID=1306991 RepID=UPI0014215691|nr:helix-turn-helix domain-containing protein [Pseudomaricurvus alkylphenolicus]NIB43777.1 helix-turn-helix domain-containing protein [Pseudomaricurvus alkylphenolicus]